MKYLKLKDLLSEEILEEASFIDHANMYFQEIVSHLERAFKKEFAGYRERYNKSDKSGIGWHYYFTAYDRSDMEVSCETYMYVANNPTHFTVSIHIVHPMKGKEEEKFELRLDTEAKDAAQKIMRTLLFWN